MKKILKVYIWNRIKSFPLPLESTKVNINNINDPVKHRSSSNDKGGKAKDKVVAPILAKSY